MTVLAERPTAPQHAPVGLSAADALIAAGVAVARIDGVAPTGAYLLSRRNEVLFVASLLVVAGEPLTQNELIAALAAAHLHESATRK